MKATRILIASLLFCSCASIMAGKVSNVDVVSASGRPVVFSTNLANVQEATTPALLTLPNGKPVTFRFGDEQYISKPSMSGWFVGNLLLGGVFGILVDIVSPSARVHSKIVLDDLTPEEALAKAEADRLARLEEDW